MLDYLIPSAETISNRCAIALAGYLFHMLFCGMKQRQNMADAIKPAVWVNHFIAAYEKKLNRARRGYGDRLFRGMLVTMPLLFAAFWIGQRLGGMHAWFAHGWLLEAAVLGLIIPWRLAFDTAWRLTTYSHDMSLYECRQLLAKAVQYDTSGLDMHGVLRQSMERLAQGFADSLVGILLWYLLLGMPGATLYYMASFLMQRLGHSHAHYSAFSLPTVGVFTALSLPVMPLAALLIAVGSIFTPATHPGKAMSALGKYASHDWWWWPVTVMAGATDSQLGGKHRVGEHALEMEWMGPGSPKLIDADLRNALRIIYVASMVVCGIIGLIYIQIG
jgi:cobalamin biosynthesis protein CobD/CbiB